MSGDIVSWLFFFGILALLIAALMLLFPKKEPAQPKTPRWMEEVEEIIAKTWSEL